MSLSPALIWNAAAIALGAIGGTLFLWAMFWDRPRGRLRCPKCWYDMRGAVDAHGDGAAVPEPPWTCSECGRVIRVPNHLRRSRRRLGVAIPCLLAVMLALYGWTARDRVLARGWLGAIPTIALAAFAPMDEAAWESQLEARPFAGNSGAPNLPPSVGTRARLLGELIQRMNYGDASLLSWRIATARTIGLTGEDHGFRFQTRSEWPRHTGVWTRVELPDRLAAHARRMEFRFRLQGEDLWSSHQVCRGASVESGQWVHVIDVDPDQICLGIPDGDAVIVEMQAHLCETRWERIRTNTYSERVVRTHLLWTGEAKIADVVDRSISDVMAPADAQPPDWEFSMLRPHFRTQRDGRVGIVFDYPQVRLRRDKCAIGCRLDVLRDDEIVATGTHMLSASGPGAALESFEPLKWLIEPPDSHGLSQHRWSLRVTGDPEVALRDFEESTFWNGSITFPLIDFFEIPVIGKE